MNLFPKAELLAITNEFKDLHNKIIKSVNNNTILNFSNKLENKKICYCPDLNHCTKNCPVCGYFEFNLINNREVHNFSINMIIKDIEMFFGKEEGSFMIFVGEKKHNRYAEINETLIFTGVFKNSHFKRTNKISLLLNVNLPAILYVKIKYSEQYNFNNVITLGAINLGIN